MSTPDNSGTFHVFHNLCKSIEDASQYTAKTEVVSNFVKSFKGDLYLLCKLLLCRQDKRVYNIKDKSLVKLMARYLKCSQNDMISDLEKGDVSETAKKFFGEHGKPATKSTLTLAKVDAWLEKLTKVTKEDDQYELFAEILPVCTTEDVKNLCRLLDHDLKIKIGPKYVLGALHPYAFDAYMNSNDLKNIIERVINHTLSKSKKGEKRKLEEGEDDGDAGEKKKLTKGGSFSTAVMLMTPVRPMLARVSKSVEEVQTRCPNGGYAEIKYDGERIQIHKQGDVLKCFSRNLKPILPWKVEAIKDYLPKSTTAKDVILDGEILLMDTTKRRPLPFGSLAIHKKNDFRDACVCVFVFDILYLEGESLLHKSIKDRRKILEKAVTVIPNRVEVSEMTFAEPGVAGKAVLQKLMTRVLREGLEGLVVKDEQGVYEPSARHWLKIKKDYLEGMADSADLVVLGAYYGSGNMGGLLSTFLMGVYDQENEAWRTVCKVGNGFDDATIAKLQDILIPKMTKIEKDFDRLPEWMRCHRTLVPDYIATNPKKYPFVP